jgi:hypothetical protein
VETSRWRQPPAKLRPASGSDVPMRYFGEAMVHLTTLRSPCSPYRPWFNASSRFGDQDEDEAEEAKVSEVGVQSCFARRGTAFSSTCSSQYQLSLRQYQRGRRKVLDEQNAGFFTSERGSITGAGLATYRLRPSLLDAQNTKWDAAIMRSMKGPTSY